MKFRNRKLYKKAHFYTILYDLARLFPLLVVPVLQNLLYKPTTTAAFITNFSISALCVVFLFAYIILEYRSTMYLEKEKSVYTKKGFFFKKRADIPYNCIQSLYVERAFMYRIFRTRKVIINTPGSYTAKGDYNLFLSKKNDLALKTEIFGKEDVDLKYNGGFLRIILMAATWSNALTGLLIIAPVLYKTSDIVVDIFKNYFVNRLDISSYIIKIGVPPAVSGLATLLIICWGIAYVYQLSSNAFFSTKIKNNIIHISRGLLNRYEFVTTTEKLNAIQIKQSVLMLLLRLKSAYIQTIGSGAQKGDRSLLIPADREENINKILSKITTLPTEENYKVKPKKTEFMSYLWFPFYCILGTVAAMLILHYLGYFAEIVRFPLFAILGVFVYWLFFRIYSYTKSSITICDKAVQIDYFDKLNITRTYIPYDKIQYVQIRQSPFQVFYKTAHLRIYVYSNKRKFYKIKYLKYKKVLEAVDIIETKMKYRY